MDPIESKKTTYPQSDSRNSRAKQQQPQTQLQHHNRFKTETNQNQDKPQNNTDPDTLGMPPTPPDKPYSAPLPDYSKRNNTNIYLLICVLVGLVCMFVFSERKDKPAAPATLARTSTATKVQTTPTTPASPATPVAQEKPIADEKPIAQEKPATQETPVAQDTPIAFTAPQTPVVEEEKNYVDLGVSVYWSVKNYKSTPSNPYGQHLTFKQIKAASTTLFTDDYGEGWRLPTRAEIEELLEKCDWHWTKNGVTVTGPNHNTIFLPATGYLYEKNLGHRNEQCAYWTSTKCTYNGLFGFFMNNEYYYDFRSYAGTTFKLFARPVLDK